MATLKVSIDRGKCIGSGNCVYVAPEVFSQDDDDGIVILLNEHPGEALTAEVMEAERQCPAMAIRVEQPGEGK